ncbi:sulfite exporter TauE/SafE family protein [Knoellia aerolata]|uniref:Probable membrane transporter protein n=1 Tax=Knoellia aerolata DSM 18566 TaxID=1385519 RepID=A0A0A0K3B9_9MICO|nr:sulfite exporter TauE/SafE family protein [Knoellia aerolata]KGN42807.1 sulfite exporter TauE/SafE family protein [Knoellia aerolata DSM 18566]
MTDWSVVLGLGAALVAGAFVQSSIGFGLAVVASPFVVVFAPDLMPGSLLVASFSLPVAQLLLAPVDIAWRQLGWALLARLAFTPLGVVAVALLSVRALSAVVAVLILVTVAASLTTLEIRTTSRNAAAAGAVAGVSGTATSIGGPFLALVLQHERPERVRSTLAAFFVVGALMAIGSLSVAGEFSRAQLLAGLAWLPFIALGYAVAAPLRRHLRSDHLRRAVLAFSAVAGASLLVRALVF